MSEQHSVSTACATRSQQRSQPQLRQCRPGAMAPLTGVILGVVLALAACQSEAGTGDTTPQAPGLLGEGSGATVPPRGGSSGPPAMPDQTTPTLPDPTPTTPVAGSRDRRVPWTLAGTEDGGRTLLLDVSVGGPPCDVVTAVETGERADAVRIAVFAGIPTGASCGGGIPAILATVRVRVLLEQPVGTRQLVDDARSGA
ncbi:MAG: hypothetical protein JXA67_10350 [Micromonosporaceae bacterium]|nr:hypothetical protein [Micromonosporaceae bacterium]